MNVSNKRLRSWKYEQTNIKRRNGIKNCKHIHQLNMIGVEWWMNENKEMGDDRYGQWHLSAVAITTYTIMVWKKEKM